MADALRVFLDANVWYSALHSPQGTPATILRHHARGNVTAVVSRQVLGEVLRVIRRKLPGGVERFRDLLRGAPPMVTADPQAQTVSRVMVTVNEDDAPIVAAALDAGVDYFVTGDLRLLKEVRRLPGAPRAVSPRELLDLIEAPAP